MNGPNTNGSEAIALVQEFYARIAEGAVPGLLELCTPDAEFHSYGPADLIPWVGLFRGVDQITDFFRRTGENLVILSFDPREFIAAGDEVVVIGSRECHVKATARSFATDWVHAFTFRHGRICRLREFHDTAAMLAAAQR